MTATGMMAMTTRSPPPATMANNDNKDENDRILRSRLIETFRPVLELLWPNVPSLESYPPALQLVQFFGSRNVWQLAGIGAFDAHHLKLNRNEWHLFESEYLVGQLGYICRFVSFLGAHALLRLLTTTANPHVAIRTIETAVARHIAKHGLYGIDGSLDLSPRGLRRLSLLQARRWLTHLLAKLDFFRLPFDQVEREAWLRHGALHLLDRFPVLASEHVRPGQIYPYAYMLWGGFGKDIVKHVLHLYPQALNSDIFSNEHMNFLKFQRKHCGVPLPWEVIQTLLAANKSLLQTTRGSGGRRSSPFLELLISTGYGEEVLVHTLRFNSIRDHINSLSLQHFDNHELTEIQAKCIEALLPQLNFLECHLNWSGRAEALLLMTVAACCKQNDNLEFLEMTLSPFAFYHDDVIRRALRNVVAHMNPALKVVSWNLQDTSQRKRTLLPEHLRAASDICLQMMLDGLHASGKNHLEDLTLQGFTLTNSENLEMILSQEDIGCLNLQLDAACDMYGFIPLPLQGRPRIDCLNLYEFSLSDETLAEESWQEFWNSVSLLNALEIVLLVPRHRNVSPAWVPHALDSISTLPHLRQLELGPHSHSVPSDDPFGNDCIDITEPLNTLLQLGCIEKLRIHGAVQQYRIDVPSFCDSLSQNKTLRTLDLLGTVLEGSTQVTKCFLDALQKSNNVTLQCAHIYDDHRFITPNNIDTRLKRNKHFRTYNYENYGYASQILHLCDSNLCGRGWIQKKSAKLFDLVRQLDDVRVTLGMETEDKKLYCFCVQAAKYNNWPSDRDHLNELYRCIRKDPLACGEASEVAQETVSIQYTLLRENPGLWCHAFVGPTGTPRKRQRVE